MTNGNPRLDGATASGLEALATRARTYYQIRGSAAAPPALHAGAPVARAMLKVYFSIKELYCKFVGLYRP